MEKLKTKKAAGPPARDATAVKIELDIPYKILPWKKFRTYEPFDYMALSRSPGFTPSESDGLVPVIERYMKQI
jgi:hypothetical protein